MAPSRIIRASPTLRADDIKSLADWYRDVLGFEVLFLWRDPPVYAMVRKDAIEFSIATKEPAFGPITAYIFVEGVDALHADWIARGARTNRRPTVSDYGMKDFDLTDPSGNRLCFGESVEHEEEANR